MEVDSGDLPDIEDELAVKPSRPELESSPRPKPEEEKENETKSPVTAAPVVKPVASSWLVFNGANLFADDDDDKSNSSSISLPNIPVSGENENEHDDDVLQLDDSSFLDEHEALKTQEDASKSSSSSNPVIDADEGLKKSKKKSSKHKKLHKKKHVENEDELPDIDNSNSNVMDEESESPIADGETKKSKRLSRNELKKMHADAQRVLREAPVAIPIRRAEPLNLDDILQEVASINSEVRKIIEKNEKKPKSDEEKPSADSKKDDVIVLGEDPTAELSNKAERADDSDVELEIVDEIPDAPLPSKKGFTETAKPVNPGVAWLMERFKKHNVPKKPSKNDDLPKGSANSWNEVKGHLQEEMAVLREKGLQERIQRYKMENEEELGEQEPEEEEAEVEPGDNSEDDDDSYTTISDDDESEEVKLERKKRKEEKNRPSANVFLDKEAAESGSDDEDYQPSEGHREEGGLSTDEGSIDSEDEKVRSGSDSDDSDGEHDSEEIEEDGSDMDDDSASDKIRSKKAKKTCTRKALESDDESEEMKTKNDDNDDDLPDLIIEDRPAMEEEEPAEKSPPKADAMLQPSITSVSSVVMPPDMPRPKELFNIYNDLFDIAMMKNGNNNNNTNEENGVSDNNMDDLLGLCTGPFLAVEPDSKKSDEEKQSESGDDDEVEDGEKSTDGDDEESNSGDESVNNEDKDQDEETEVQVVKKVTHVYGGGESKKEKKERRKQMREFFEDEAELSESDQENGRVSDDEDEGSSSEDSYETDPEFEDEALAKLSAAQLQKQVESIHMKQVIDEDERDLLHLREAIIPDADLADAVGPRLRRFRWAEAWRDMGGTDLASQGENVHADDDYLGLAALDATAPGTGGTALGSMWQKQRVERERWLHNQQAQQTESDSQTIVVSSAEVETTPLNDTAGSECQLVRLGISAMRKSTGGVVAASASFSAASNSSVVTSSENSSSNSQHIPRRISHGSMLSWLQQKELDKIAQTVGGANNSSSNSNASNMAKRRSGAAVASHSAGGADPKPEDMMTTTSGFKSRSSAGPFIVVSDEASPIDRKRKFDNGGTASSTSSASKRGKPQQSSVFDFLS